MNRPDLTPAEVVAAAIPLPAGAAAEDTLFQELDQASIVLIGEASHGTY